jgi:predicted nucleic acid-binding protein
MIVLDTNVLSELMKPQPEPLVFQWVARQPRPALFTTAVTMGEILSGLELLPAGRRRAALTAAAGALFEESLAGRVLPFDSDAAERYATIAAARHRAGRPISPFDAQIASIVSSRGAALATRNTADFERCGIHLVNPWTK